MDRSSLNMHNNQVCARKFEIDGFKDNSDKIIFR